MRRPPGYVLRVEPDELDRDRFEELFRAGREALGRGDAAEASAALQAALGLWRGPALADVLDEPFAGAESGSLEERRLRALEERIEADLARGAAAELMPELEELVREEPFRERPLGQLMLALYARGGSRGAVCLPGQGGRDSPKSWGSSSGRRSSNCSGRSSITTRPGRGGGSPPCHGCGGADVAPSPSRCRRGGHPAGRRRRTRTVLGPATASRNQSSDARDGRARLGRSSRQGLR